MSGVVRYADLAITPWRNGAGRKADIAGGDGWTVGFAFLDGDAPFSDFAGHDRTIMLVGGDGFELDVAGQGVLRIDRPHVPVRFDGGAPATCRLLGGPCLVLNAMTERDAMTHRVEIGPAPPRVDGSRFVVLLQGRASLGAERLDPFDGAQASGELAGDVDALFWIVRLEAVPKPCNREVGAVASTTG